MNTGEQAVMATGEAIYPALAKVVAAVAQEGVSKSRQVTEGPARFRFRGIDEVMNALAPIFAANKVALAPRFSERIVSERQTNNGRAMFNVTVRGEFDFVSLEDGSRMTVATYGEAMDSGDKATNKAMSAAYKYAMFQGLCIPTEGDGDTDPDAVTHEAPARKDAPKDAPKVGGAPSRSDAGAAETALTWTEGFISGVRAAKDLQVIEAAQLKHKATLAKLRAGHPEYAERIQAAIKVRLEELDPLDDDIPF